MLLVKTSMSVRKFPPRFDFAEKLFILIMKSFEQEPVRSVEILLDT